MASTTFSIRIDEQAVRQLFSEAPKALTDGTRRLIESSAIDVQRQMIMAANVGVTGDLRRSITYKVTPALLQAEIGPTADYAEPVEYGSRPHYVSVADGTPLAQWARMKGINKYALQNSISKRGTRAHPFVRPTYDRMRPKVVRDISSGIASLVGSLGRG